MVEWGMRRAIALGLALAVLAPLVTRAEGTCQAGPDGRVVCRDGGEGLVIRPDGSLKLDGRPFTLMRIDNGLAGRIGDDKLVLQRQGDVMVGRIGGRKLICFADPAIGLSVCK